MSQVNHKNTIPLTTNIAWFKMLDRAAIARGFDPSIWFESKHEYDQIKQSKTILICQLRQFLYHLFDYAGGYKVIIEASEFFDPMDFGSAGIAVCSAPDLKASIKLFSEISPCFGISIQTVYHETSSKAELWLVHNEVKSLQNVITYLGLTLYCAVLAKLIRYVTGHGALPVLFKLPGWILPLENIKEISEVFHCEIKFGSEIRSMSIDQKWLALPLVHADHELHTFTRQAAYSQLQQLKQSNMTMRVLAILEGLEVKNITAEYIAQVMHISMRTLSRKLTQENTNFRKVVERFRFEKSVNLLPKKDSNITQIAFELGFSDLSSFSRAFKSWSGMSPKQFKETNTLD